MNANAISNLLLHWQKKWLWLTALLPLLFISDIFYGAMGYYGIKFSITPGVILRGIVVLVAINMVIRYHHLVGDRLRLWIGLLALFVVPSIFVSVFHEQNLFIDISAISKVLYLPLVTGLFVVLMRRYCLNQVDVLRFIEYAAYVLGAVLLGSQMLGVEKQTYGDYAFGSTGIFYAQNDITLAFGLALLAGGYRLVMDKFSPIRFALLALSAFACVQIGTRASLFVVLGTALTVVVCALWGRERGKGRRVIENIKKRVIVLLVLVVMIGVLLYGLDKQQEFGYQQQKLEEIASGNLPRLPLLLAGAQHISDRPFLYDLVGEGFDAFRQGVAKHIETEGQRRLVEVDWMDIFGCYGIGFALLIHVFVLNVLWGSFRRFIFQRKSVYGFIAAATLLYLGHSAFAGHALFSPIPGTLMAAYFACYFVGYRLLIISLIKKEINEQ